MVMMKYQIQFKNKIIGEFLDYIEFRKTCEQLLKFKNPLYGITIGERKNYYKIEFKTRHAKNYNNDNIIMKKINKGLINSDI